MSGGGVQKKDNANVEDSDRVWWALLSISVLPFHTPDVMCCFLFVVRIRMVGVVNLLVLQRIFMTSGGLIMEEKTGVIGRRSAIESGCLFFSSTC